MRFPAVSIARALAAAAVALAASTAAAQSNPEARHFLWEVTSMTNRAYLFGTIHAGKKEWFPLAPAVEAALADSQVLVVEADVTDIEAMSKTTGSMSYTPPDELSKHVFPGDYERFRRQLDRLGVPEERVRHLRPFAAVSLVMFGEWARLGYLPQYGIDGYLLQKAKATKKRVVEIEGVETQAKPMDSLTEDEHRRVFAGTLDALESGLTGDQVEGMVKAWLLGDAFLMLELARRYNEKVVGAAELEEKFIWSRHKDMLAKIEGYLNKSKDRHFIAVGSLHLSGNQGLVEMLRSRGYLVRQK